MAANTQSYQRQGLAGRAALWLREPSFTTPRAGPCGAQIGRWARLGAGDTASVD